MPCQIRKVGLSYSKTGFGRLKRPDECPIPNIRVIKADKSQIVLENRLSNSYIWDTIGSVL
ncbi:hypothetical protein J2Y45_002450 [Dyadobacter sp. BE34]|uniref:Uncharacterized protein n=1 Tax=Dyadobacter fermentans TaxID=94254 RepID=A0ABU1QVQ0_9BACT|nr:hypothetical protein [Dyadobacter fermentans]MDR7042999.1 hypothetical protein [Dyadobacter sp. BE242]MDR7197311.1 hypothetical protein [Dyadobacter sp. BE34]MDR7215254.1 hypothetical protein [Dyadobacter sp. BE31]MDR7262790.1 hypothetical protein [Dyadobacter sp. BE32]